RAQPPDHPRRAPPRGATGLRAGREARHEPTGRLETPAGASRRGPGQRPSRRATAALQRPAQSPGRAGRLARALPPAVDQEPRPARTPPGCSPTHSKEEAEMSEATLMKTGARPVLRFERHLHQPVDEVWQAVTDPEEMRSWFPPPIAMDEWKVGAGITPHFDEHAIEPLAGTVLEWDPPRRVSFTWGDDIISFELTG